MGDRYIVLRTLRIKETTVIELDRDFDTYDTNNMVLIKGKEYPFRLNSIRNWIIIPTIIDNVVNAGDSVEVLRKRGDGIK